jgi:hypothetical protein
VHSVTADDWSFDEIREVCAARADRLEHAGSSDDLMAELAVAAVEGLKNDTIRFGIDSINSEFRAVRVTIQYQVSPDLFDWFFNGRTGYRAQFWVSPDVGLHFNSNALKLLLKDWGAFVDGAVSARMIRVDPEDHHEKDVGPYSIAERLMKQSLHPDFSKFWICERLIQPSGGDPKCVGGIIDACSRPKLVIPRWANATPKKGDKGEGCRAPYPEREGAWIDLKGGFVEDGELQQIKPPLERALSLNACGWT